MRTARTHAHAALRSPAGHPALVQLLVPHALDAGRLRSRRMDVLSAIATLYHHCYPSRQCRPLALFAVGLLKALSVDVGGLGALQRFGASASDAELDTAVAEWQAYEDRSSAAVAATVVAAVASVEARVLRVVVGESGAAASTASQPLTSRTSAHAPRCMCAALRGRLRLALCETRAVALALRTGGTRTETGWRRPLRVSWRRRGCAQPPRACPRVESDRARRTPRHALVCVPGFSAPSAGAMGACRYLLDILVPQSMVPQQGGRSAAATGDVQA